MKLFVDFEPIEAFQRVLRLFGPAPPEGSKPWPCGEERQRDSRMELQVPGESQPIPDVKISYGAMVVLWPILAELHALPFYDESKKVDVARLRKAYESIVGITTVRGHQQIIQAVRDQYVNAWRNCFGVDKSLLMNLAALLAKEGNMSFRRSKLRATLSQTRTRIEHRSVKVDRVLRVMETILNTPYEGLKSNLRYHTQRIQRSPSPPGVKDSTVASPRNKTYTQFIQEKARNIPPCPRLDEVQFSKWYQGAIAWIPASRKPAVKVPR